MQLLGLGEQALDGGHAERESNGSLLLVEERENGLHSLGWVISGRPFAKSSGVEELASKVRRKGRVVGVGGMNRDRGGVGDDGRGVKGRSDTGNLDVPGVVDFPRERLNKRLNCCWSERLVSPRQLKRSIRRRSRAKGTGLPCFVAQYKPTAGIDTTPEMDEMLMK